MYYDLWRGAPPPYPSLADVGYLGIYVCLIAGVMTLVRGQPSRPADPDLVLDTVLVTFTVGALAYEYLLEPLFSNSGSVSGPGLLTSIGWSIGAVAVLWMILMQMLRRTVFPAAIAADYAQHLERRTSTRPETGVTTRLVALVIGLVGMTAMAIAAVLRPTSDAHDALIIGVGLAIGAARVVYSLGVDRRYEEVLEGEVASQTRSLMSSLGAT